MILSHCLCSLLKRLSLFLTPESFGGEERGIWTSARVEASELKEGQRTVLIMFLIGVGTWRGTREDSQEGDARRSRREMNLLLIWYEENETGDALASLIVMFYFSTLSLLNKMKFKRYNKQVKKKKTPGFVAYMAFMCVIALKSPLMDSSKKKTWTLVVRVPCCGCVCVRLYIMFVCNVNLCKTVCRCACDFVSM